jgi:hypothetical protein
MEVPPANDRSLLYGQVVDAWQVSVADIGPSGEDKGKGGKYLFTPPGWSGEVPTGFIHVSSQSYRQICCVPSKIMELLTRKQRLTLIV